MSEQEVEEQISSDENLNDETGEDNLTPDKASSNKSNFKKLSEAKKALERELSDAREELESWRSENPELVEKALTKKWSTSEIEEIRTDIFLTKNPEAEQHMEEIKVFTDKGFSLKDAWKYVKPTIIKESETTRDFDVKGKVKSSKVDLTKLPMNEAYEEGRLTPEQRKEWRKIHMG